MEIHTPDHAPETWKETVKHLAMITAGVLIALAFEGVAAWVDHRMLVRDARANLAAEIQANRRELDAMLGRLGKETQGLEHADDIAALLLKHPAPPPQMEIELASVAAELKNAAVTAGQITGAFGYMQYAEVRRYANIYDMQAQFLRLQEREGQNFSAIFGFVRRLADSPPPADAAIEEWRVKIDAALAGIFVRERLARQLMTRYEELSH